MVAGMDSEPTEADSRMKEFRGDIAPQIWIVYQACFLDSFKPESILVKTITNRKFVRARNSAAVTVVFEADRCAERTLLART